MEPLRILVIEDVRTDFLLLERHLLQNGVHAHCVCVDRLATLKRALAQTSWDIILADYNVPNLPFEASLEAIRTTQADVPVILVSGSVGEERAVALLRQGVADFVLKDNRTRLVPAIERALLEAQEKRARRVAEAALRENELRLRLAVDAARAGTWEWDVRTQQNVWSDEIWTLYGLAPFSCEPSYGAWADTIHPDDRVTTQSVVSEAASQGVEFEIEWRVQTGTDKPRWLMARGRPVRDAAGQLERYLGIVMDVTQARLARFALENHANLLERDVAARTVELSAAKAELRQQFTELQEAQRLAQVGSWEWRLESDTLLWSEEIYRITGRDPALPAPRRAEHAALLQPAGWVQLRSAARKLLENAPPYLLELEVLRADGTSRWVIARGEAVRDSENAIRKLRGTLQDVTERKRLEEASARLSLRAAELSRHLVLVQEEERRRLTMLIDDVLSPNLAAAQLTLRQIAAHLPAHTQRKMDTQLADVRALVEDSVTNLRGLSADLRPAVLDYAGLHAAVESYAEQFSTRTGLTVSFRGHEPTHRWPQTVESCLFRIVQEALANCHHHAQARHVSISLQQDGPLIQLRIEDDGVGFAPGDIEGPDSGHHIGLATMLARAEFVGGNFVLAANPGGGTRIQVDVAVAGMGGEGLARTYPGPMALHPE